jgi:tRNA-dihydrouridine synthase C
MYKPPAFWEWIPRIREVAPQLRIIANGEIWNVADYWRCREITACEEVMIGRGAIADPDLFLKIRSSDSTSLDWQKVREIFPNFYLANRAYKGEAFAQARTKQWLSQVAKRNEPARELFDRIKTIRPSEEFFRALQTTV